jgi:SulP family sulfate permease
MLGIQLGVGLYLSWAGIQLIAADASLGVVALVVLLLFQLSPWKPAAVPVVLIIGVGYSVLFGSTPLPALSLGFHLPGWVLPGMENFVTAARDVFLPQLALTLTNATLVTAAIAAERFPGDRARITPKRLSVSTGGLNMLLAPFGAFPMCHGAGGLVVQYRFGARTGLAPAIFGGSCLLLGVFLGADGLALLQIIPLAVVGAMLAVAGADLALTRRLRSTSPDRMVLIGITGLTCLFGNVALGLLVGVLLELVRVWLFDKER